MQDSQDWMIDANGFYIATRSFLVRRGFCCANQCRNCPYINWRNSPTWKPLPAEVVCVTKVSPKAVEGAQKALLYHEEQLRVESRTKDAFHQAMILHYRLLLEHWEASKE
jgi:hypothetical protein